MKKNNKENLIRTIPKGIWEGSPPKKSTKDMSSTTDLQGNGYPTPNNSKENH
ncbi:MAG: hypothetical protein K6G85_09585 [Eubacterium sp.]|nr:hypothetical protein [Eubacterium sp.]